MAGSSAPGVHAVLQRMYERHGIDTLPAHLEEVHAIPIAKMSQLDVGVFRIDRRDKATPVLARLFSAARPNAAAQADLAALDYLAEIGYPAERPYQGTTISSHEGQPLLLTEFVRTAPKTNRPAYPIFRLGAMIGRLHTFAVPVGADRPSGALHHFAEGTMSDELRAAEGWLNVVESQVPSGGHEAFDALRDAVAAADGGSGLPEAFVHPDPVPKNVIFTATGPVLVDWTSAGRGPRLTSMTLLLKSGWAAIPFMKGYSTVVSLTDDEWARLPELLFSRRLIELAFRFCRDPNTPVASAKKLLALRRQCEAKAVQVRRA